MSAAVQAMVEIVGMIGGGFGMGLLVGAFRSRPERGTLPCPHPLCRNRLPRQAAIGPYGWVEEDCNVCLGRVRFISCWSPFGDNAGRLDSADRWVRVHVPEAR